MSELGHRVDARELPLVVRREFGKPELWRRTTRAPIRLADRVDRILIASRSRMTRLAARERLGEHAPGARRTLRWELVDRLAIAVQLEVVILHPTTNDERRSFAVGIVDDFALRHRRVWPQQVVRDLRAFDRCARIAELVGEITKLAGDRAPAATHAGLRH